MQHCLDSGSCSGRGGNWKTFFINSRCRKHESNKLAGIGKCIIHARVNSTHDMLFINGTGHRFLPAHFIALAHPLFASIQPECCECFAVLFDKFLRQWSSYSSLFAIFRPPPFAFGSDSFFPGDISSVDIALYLFRFFYAKSTALVLLFQQGLAFMQTDKNCWKMHSDRHNRISERSDRTESENSFCCLLRKRGVISEATI